MSKIDTLICTGRRYERSQIVDTGGHEIVTVTSGFLKRPIVDCRQLDKTGICRLSLGIPIETSGLPPFPYTCPRIFGQEPSEA